MAPCEPTALVSQPDINGSVGFRVGHASSFHGQDSSSPYSKGDLEATVTCPHAIVYPKWHVYIFMVKYFDLFKMSYKRHAQNWRELFSLSPDRMLQPSQNHSPWIFFTIVYELDKIRYFSRAPVLLRVTPRCFSTFGIKRCVKIAENADEISNVLQNPSISEHPHLSLQYDGVR